MSIIWEDLGFSTDRSILEKLLAASCCGCCLNSNSKRKQILNKLHGTIKRGELIALMGPSGAGKSTLLNCITQGRKYKGFEGRLKVSNLFEPVRASFISQDEKEHLLLTLTVSQSLRYASQLKNPPRTPKAVHNEIVQRLITELELDGTENTSVHRCSGGQKKRLAIALELTALAKPHFLFLDEPTSGLDSYVGLKVIELLSGLASIHNMAIVATIHQPSYKLFSLFSRAFIISGTGDFIYNSTPENLNDHLVSFGYKSGSRCNNENPADIAIELASAINRDTAFRMQRSNHNGNSEVYMEDEEIINVHNEDQGDDENVQICLKMMHQVQLEYSQNERIEDCIEIQKHGLCKNGATFGFYNLWILFIRSAHTSIWKQKRFILIRLGLHVIVAGLLAVLYSRDIGSEDGCISIVQESTMNCTPGVTDNGLQKESTTMKNVKFQFFSLLFLMFAALMPTVLTFPADIKLFINEHRNGWYSTSSYYISKTVTEIPLQLLFPFLYTYFLYWFSNQPGMDHWYGGLIGLMSWRYGTFLLVTTLSCFIAQGLGFLIGILCVRSFNISIIVSSSVLLFLFLFSGFFVRRVQMAASVSWITSLSFIRFAFESLLILIYGKNRCNHSKQPSILIIFGLHDDDVKSNIWYLVVHLFVIRLLAFFVLKYMADPDSISVLCCTNNKAWNSVANYLVSIHAKSKPMRRKLGSVVVKSIFCCLIFLLVQIVVGIVLIIVHSSYNGSETGNDNDTSYANSTNEVLTIV